MSWVHHTYATRTLLVKSTPCVIRLLILSYQQKIFGEWTRKQKTSVTRGLTSAHPIILCSLGFEAHLNQDGGLFVDCLSVIHPTQKDAGLSLNYGICLLSELESTKNTIRILSMSHPNHNI